MRIFLDTADPAVVAQFAAGKYIDGVTTNPSLAAKAGGDYRKNIAEIAALVDGPISAEGLSEDAETIFSEGMDLARIAPNVIIKVPITQEGLKAVARLNAHNVKTNVTLVFSVAQAVLAARSGASYVSPFVGRLDDVGEDGIGLVADIVHVFRIHEITTQVIAASIRSTAHVEEAALAGAHVATIPPKVLEEMFKHPLTNSGIKRFKADWQAAFGE